MDREERCAAKAQMVAQMQIGQSWQEAATRAGVQTSRTAAYRLLQRVRIEGAIALRDQRHGHPAKLRGPVREWLAELCRAAPESTGRTAQAALFERFGLEVSVCQINRLRAALGVRRPAWGKNQPNRCRLPITLQAGFHSHYSPHTNHHHPILQLRLHGVAPLLACTNI